MSMKKGDLVIIPDSDARKVYVVLYVYEHGINDDKYARIYELREGWTTSFLQHEMVVVGNVDEEHVYTITGGAYR